MPLFQIQDSDTPIHVIAEDFQKAIERWRKYLDRFDPDNAPFDGAMPRGVTIVAEDDELVMMDNGATLAEFPMGTVKVSPPLPRRKPVGSWRANRPPVEELCTVPLSDVTGTRVEIPPDGGSDGKYFIEVSELPVLLLTFGAKYGTKAAVFDSPNLLLRVPKVEEFKHHHPTRGKFWTSRAGIQFAFAFDPSEVLLVLEKTWSYPRLVIAGREYRSSVCGASGGNRDGWTDYLRPVADMGTGYGVSHLSRVAAAAIPPDRVPFPEEEGAREALNRAWIPKRDEDDRKRYHKLAAEVCGREALKVGQQVTLDAWHQFRGSKGPFPIVVVNRRNRAVIAQVDYCTQCRITYGKIDWVKFTEENNIDVPIPEVIQRVVASEPEKQPVPDMSTV